MEKINGEIQNEAKNIGFFGKAWNGIKTGWQVAKPIAIPLIATAAGTYFGIKFATNGLVIDLAPIAPVVEETPEIEVVAEDIVDI